jgi:hemolysin-activating ACP:hemolysin acyltransferase
LIFDAGKQATFAPAAAPRARPFGKTKSAYKKAKSGFFAKRRCSGKIRRKAEKAEKYFEKSSK